VEEIPSKVWRDQLGLGAGKRRKEAGRTSDKSG